MKLDADTARDIAYRASDPDRYTHVAEEHLGESRWGIIKRTVFIDKQYKKYYAFTWEQGATEMQDYDEFDNGDIDIEEVNPVKVEVTEYHKV